MFKPIGCLNPPKNGSLIMVRSKAIQMTGVIRKVTPFSPTTTMKQGGMWDSDEVEFWASQHQAHRKAGEGYSPFGDIAYTLDIVWESLEKSLWVLEHPEPDAYGVVNKPLTEQKGVVVVKWTSLTEKPSILVA